MSSPAQADGTATPQAWLAVVLVTVGFTLSYCDRHVLSLLVTPIKADLRISDTRMGLLQGLGFSAFYVIASLPLARIADRGHRPRVIAACMAFWSLMTMACGAAASFVQLLLTRIGIAAGEAGLPPAALTLMADTFDRRRLPRATAVFMLAPFIGGGLALLGGGLLYAMAESWRAPVLPLLGELRPWQMVFMLVGAPGLLVALVIAIVLREPRPHRAHAAGGGSTRAMLRYVVSEWRFSLLYMIGTSLLVTVLNAHIGWMPTSFVRSHGAAPGEIGVVFGPVYLLAGAAGTVLAGWLAGRGGDDPIGHQLRWMRLGVLLLLVPAVAAPLAPTLYGGLAAIGVAVFLMSAIVAMASLPFQYSAPIGVRAQVLALFGLLSSLLGTGLGPLLVGVLSDAFAGSEHPLARALVVVAAGLLPLIALLLHVALRQHRRIRLDLRQHDRTVA
ncbi:MAG: MFS transporter [Steroidobacteraceae bacterium]